MTATYSAPNTGVAFDYLAVDDVFPSPLNPRKHFDPEHLSELADSIRAHGVLQPIVVRPGRVEIADKFGDELTIDGYYIVAGERRWRASKLAGLDSVPATILTNITDEEHLRLALIENLQRQDLDPIEEAEGYAQLNRVVGLRQAEIAAAVNRSQPAVANAMRLLELPEDVRERIRNRELSVAHGVALARYKDFPALVSRLAELAAEQSWTSKRLEERDAINVNPILADGLVKRIENNAPFDTAICEQCPFNAFRANKENGSWYIKGWCLKPEHYDELVAAARAEHEAAMRAAVEKTSVAGAAPVLLLSNLKWDEYERIYPGSTTPSGCSSNCACRTTAIDGNAKAVPICTDPKRYKRLQSSDTRRANQERKEQIRELSDRLEPCVDAILYPGSRELAMLVLHIISHTYGQDEHYSATRRHAPDRLPEERPETYRLGVEVVEHFATLSPVELVRIGVELLLRRSMNGHLHGYSSREPWIDFYLAESSDTQIQESSSDGMPLPEASASGETVECYLCGDVMAVEDAEPTFPGSGEWICAVCDESGES